MFNHRWELGLDSAQWMFQASGCSRGCDGAQFWQRLQKLCLNLSHLLVYSLPHSLSLAGLARLGNPLYRYTKLFQEAYMRFAVFATAPILARPAYGDP